MKKIIITLLLVNNLLIHAQQRFINKGDKYYETFSYAKAAKEYLKVKNLEYNGDVMLKLANCYFFNNDYDSAEYYYDLFAKFNTSKIEDSLSLSRYNQIQTRKKEFLFETYYKSITEFNFKYDLVSISKRNDRYLISTNKPPIDDKVHAWSNKPFYNIYEAKLDTIQNQINLGLKFQNINNHPYHVSNVTVSNNGKIIYFNKTIHVKKENKELTYLKIFAGKLKDGLITDIYECSSPLNEPNISYAHPFISPDNKLYFSYNKHGNSDLCYIQLNSEGLYSSKTPIIELNDLNTKYREDFPHADIKGNIYFSSDNPMKSKGGLDVFIARKFKNKFHYQSMGNEINSKDDDFGILTEKSDTIAYLISNRNKEKKDKLYKFKKVKNYNWGFNEMPQIYGIVRDSLTNNPISKASVYITDKNFKKLAAVVTDSVGRYSIDVPLYKEFKIYYSSEDYSTKFETLPMFLEPELVEKNILLLNEKILRIEDKLITLDDGMDLFKLMKLKPIYFSFNGFGITNKSKIELDKIVKVMKEKPKLKLEITSHTDNKGTNEYNQKLSENRANSTVKYLIDSGIEGSRLNAIGFGETKPIHECQKCSESQNAENRRSEFLVKFENHN